MGSTLDDFKEDPFKNKDAFGGDSSGGGSDPFQSDDPFKEGRLKVQSSDQCFIFWYKRQNNCCSL